MRRPIVAAAIAGAALLLTACGLDHGTVTDKYIDPARTTMVTSCHLIGKITVCTPMPVFDDQDWVLVLQEGTGDDAETGAVEVTEDTYNAVQIGDYFDATPED